MAEQDVHTPAQSRVAVHGDGHPHHKPDGDDHAASHPAHAGGDNHLGTGTHEHGPRSDSAPGAGHSPGGASAEDQHHDGA